MKRFVFGISLLLILVSANALESNLELTQVESKMVCMVNNTLFPREQIPVRVGQKTYYGCCENCKKTLVENRGSRSAIDPVSNKPIDKAIAVIGADEKGKVYYFETLKNLKKFSRKKNN